MCYDLIYFKTTKESDVQVAIYFCKCINALIKVWENIHHPVNSGFLCNLRMKRFKVKIKIKSFPGVREYFGLAEMSQLGCGDSCRAVQIY